MGGRSDDDAWLDALAGRDPGRGHDDATMEADALRQAMLRTSSDKALHPVPALLPFDQWQAERGAARERGLGTRPRSALLRLLEFLRSATQLQAMPVAAAALFVAVALPVSIHVGQRHMDTSAQRSAVTAVTVLTVAHPKTARDALAAHLARHGIDHKAYERMSRYGIDADLPANVPASLAAYLDSIGAAVQPDRSLRVEFEVLP